MKAAVLLFAALFFFPTALAARFEFKHSFRAPFYLIRGTTIPFWDFGGSAVITEDFVRLTPALESKAGWIWNRRPLDLTDWEAEIQFQIHGGGRMGADGMAFWFADEPSQNGEVFGSKNKWNGLGVFFDSFDNDRDGKNPTVTVVHNKGNIEYDIATDGRYQALGTCTFPFRSDEYRTNAKITYLGGKLTVQLQVDNTEEWTDCAKDVPIDLPPGKFFGLSADTGGLFDNHDVFSFRTTNLMTDEQRASARDTVDQIDNLLEAKEELQELEEQLEQKLEEAENPDTKWQPKRKADERSEHVKELLERLKGIKPELKQQPAHQEHAEPVLVMPAADSEVATKEDLLPIFQQLNQLLVRQEEIYTSLITVESSIDESFDSLDSIDVVFSDSFREIIEEIEGLSETITLAVANEVETAMANQKGSSSEVRKIASAVGNIQSQSANAAKSSQVLQLISEMAKLQSKVTNLQNENSDKGSWTIWAIIVGVQVLVVIILSLVFGGSKGSTRRLPL